MRITLLIFFIFFIGCNASSILSNTVEEKESIISLSRTACYGTCPVYTIKIFPDGTGIYNGVRFVEFIGEKKFSVKKNQINSIFRKAEEIGFSSMKNKYTELITDLPTCYVTIKNKQIEDYYGAPKELKDLEKMIDNLYFEGAIR